MAKLMTARYRGTCRGCAAPIAPGASILFAGKGNVRHADCADVADESVVDPETGMRWSARGQSGRGGYVTSGGRCEDAPCCGCC